MKEIDINPLALARAKQNMSQRQLAKKAGIQQASLARLESGKRKARLTTLVKLSKTLNIELSDILNLLDTSAPERGITGYLKRQEPKDTTLANLFNEDTSESKKVTSNNVREPIRKAEPGPTNQTSVNIQTIDTSKDDERVRQFRRDERERLKAARAQNAPGPDPIQSWVGLEDGSWKDFKKKHLDASDYAKNSGQRAIIYHGTIKQRQKAYDMHKSFVQQWNDALTDWTPRIKEIKIALPDEQGKESDQARVRLGPATCSECGRPAQEGTFLCPKHMKEK